MLKDVGKGYQLAAAGINTIAYHHVVRIVGRSNKVQSSVGFGVFHMEFQQVKSIVEREVLSQVLQVEGIEAGLCFTQGNFHFAGLKHLRRMIRTHAQGQSAVDNVFS